MDVFSNPGASGLCSGPGGKFNPALVSWEDPTWQALHFSIDIPFLYSYDWDVPVSGSLSMATNVGDMFEISAYGDLNCNGVWSRISRRGTVAADRSLVGSALQSSNILE